MQTEVSKDDINPISPNAITDEQSVGKNGEVSRKDVAAGGQSSIVTKKHSELTQNGLNQQNTMAQNLTLQQISDPAENKTAGVPTRNSLYEENKPK